MAELVSQPEFAQSLNETDSDVLARAVPNRDVGMVHLRAVGDSASEPGASDAAAPASVKLLAASKLRSFLASSEQMPADQRRYLAALSQVVESHHERWDGSGYPNGLKGDDIPLPGRIAALVDAYESLVNDRPYRPARSHEEAVSIIESEAGTRFDPRLVQCFSRVIRQQAGAP